MSFHIIDRRNNDKGKSSENRHRLLKRIENQVKKILPDLIKNTNVKDITSTGKEVKIPVKSINEPQFQYDPSTGNKKHIQPGNKQFQTGDKIDKPPSGQGGGSGGTGQQGSKDPGTSEDDFTISISKEEFLDFFFNDLALPDLVKKQLNSIVDFKQKRAGFTNAGNPSRLNIVRSYKNSLSRRLAASVFFEKKIQQLKNQLTELEAQSEEAKTIEKEIERLEKMKLTVSFMEEADLQYNNFQQYPVPITSAVMFCIMDVSGSMGEREKDIAKRFFMLLYIFLTKQYERIEIVFIRHHTEAKEVTEEEFFNSKESGGTIVYPALELMRKIIRERYASNWNIYAAQASDGDVWNKTDAQDCGGIIQKDILNQIQYMVYIEVCRNRQSDLWDAYELIQKTTKQFAMARINEVNEIWKVFQEFFKKKSV